MKQTWVTWFPKTSVSIRAGVSELEQKDSFWELGSTNWKEQSGGALRLKIFRSLYYDEKFRKPVLVGGDIRSSNWEICRYSSGSRCFQNLINL